MIIELDNFETATLAYLFDRMRHPVHTIQVCIENDQLHIQFDHAGWSPPMGKAIS